MRKYLYTFLASVLLMIGGMGVVSEVGAQESCNFLVLRPGDTMPSPISINAGESIQLLISNIEVGGTPQNSNTTNGSEFRIARVHPNGTSRSPLINLTNSDLSSDGQIDMTFQPSIPVGGPYRLELVKDSFFGDTTVCFSTNTVEVVDSTNQCLLQFARSDGDFTPIINGSVTGQNVEIRAGETVRLRLSRLSLEHDLLGGEARLNNPELWSLGSPNTTIRLGGMTGADLLASAPFEMDIPPSVGAFKDGVRQQLSLQVGGELICESRDWVDVDAETCDPPPELGYESGFAATIDNATETGEWFIAARFYEGNLEWGRTHYLVACPSYAPTDLNCTRSPAIVPEEGDNIRGAYISIGRDPLFDSWSVFLTQRGDQYLTYSGGVIDGCQVDGLRVDTTKPSVPEDDILNFLTVPPVLCILDPDQPGCEDVIVPVDPPGRINLPPAELTCEGDGLIISTAIGCIPVLSFDDLTASFVLWGIGIGGGIGFILIVIAGFMIMTSQGDPRRLQAGKELMFSAIAGIVLIIFSVFLIRFLGEDLLSIF